MPYRRTAILFTGLLFLAACENADVESNYPSPDSKKQQQVSGKAFGDKGLMLFGTGEEPESGAGGSIIGVNSYLWRATLDTVSFMPLASADPFGGVVITDWYAPPGAQNERFKLNVYILGADLRADGVRASVFRQLQDGSGNWIDSAVDEQTGTDLEDAILTRARQLRIAGLQ
jgi:hypothetical protein